MLQGSALGSQVLLGQSDHFRKTIGIHWGMVAIAIPLNLWMIPDSGLGLGLWGAALATLSAMLFAVIVRQVVVWQIWRQWTPNLHSLFIVMLVALPGQALHLWTPGWHPAIAVLAKGAIATLWVASGAWWLNLVPEGKALVQRRILGDRS